MEENNIQNNTTPEPTNPAPEESSSTTDASSATPGLGLKGSILKPQTEKDKKEYEKAIEKANGGTSGLPIKTIISVLVIVLLVAAVVTNKGAIKKIVAKTTTVAEKKAPVISTELKIIEVEPVVLGNNLRLRVKTTAKVDKTTLLLDGKMTVGTMLNEEEGNKNWEFTVQSLKKGSYTFKCYAKETKANKFVFQNGSFTVK